MAKIRVDSGGITEIHTIVEQQAQTMQRAEQTISQVLKNLDVQIAATENIKQSLTSLKNSSTKERELLFGMSNALIRVNDEFQSTDHGLSDKARDVNYALDYIIADASNGFGERIPLELMTPLLSTEALSKIFGINSMATTPLSLGLLLGSPAYLELQFNDTAWDILGGVNKTSSFIKDAGDYAEWIELLFDNDMYGELSDFLGDIPKNDFFKAAGFTC